MSKVIFITGTNAVGKSTLALALIDHYGGISDSDKDITFCKDGKTCFVGRYDGQKYGGQKYGGVDRLRNANGSSCTSRLAEVVERALQTHQRVICEGSYMNTFGLNLTNALFKAQEQTVINLYASPQEIIRRLQQRSNGKNNKRDIESVRKVLLKQRTSMSAAAKYYSIGVPVLQIDTGETAFEDELQQVIKAIET